MTNKDRPDDMPPNPYLTYAYNGSEYTVFKDGEPVLPGQLKPDQEYLLTINNGICSIEEVKTVNGRPR